MDSWRKHSVWLEHPYTLQSSTNVSTTQQQNRKKLETKDIYDTSKITNRQSSPNPVNFCFDTDNILDKLTHLNIYKSPGPDGFHPRVLFEIRH